MEVVKPKYFCETQIFSGGRYYDHSRNAHIELSSVEVVGPGGGTCQAVLQRSCSTIDGIVIKTN